MLVSAEHERRGVKHDASSVWIEDVTTTSFKICIRELQNFDGAHQSIHVVSNFQLFILVNTSRIVSVSYIYSVREIIYQTRERESVSSGYPNTEKKVENTTRSGVFLTTFKVFG